MVRFGAKVSVAVSLILLNSSWTAWGCERSVELGSEQIRHHIDLIKSTDADGFAQIEVLETLMCADKLSVRDLAARTAINSPNESVRASALFEIMMQKQNMVIELIAEDGISNDVRDYIDETVALGYDFRFVDRDASCIGLDNSSCSSYFLDITGMNVEVKYGSDIGSFTLDQNGELRGYYKPNGVSAKVPARIKLL